MRSSKYAFFDRFSSENFFLCPFWAKEVTMWEKLDSFYNEELDAILVNIDKLFDSLSNFALYVTIALLVGIVVYAVAIRNKDEAYLKQARRTILGVVVGYSVGIIAMLGYVKILYYVLDGKIGTGFWLTVGMFGVVALCFVAHLLVKNKGTLAKRITTVVSVAIAVAYLVVLLVVGPTKSETYQPLSTSAMYVLTALLVAVICALALLCDKKQQSDVSAITNAAICVAMSFALSYVKFFSMPQGGSVTFASMLPIAIYSYKYGTRRGVLAGVVYGLLQFVQSPQFYQPMQVIVDYPIAFATIGLVAVGKKLPFAKNNVVLQFALGATISLVLRYIAHCISGYFVFSSWMMEGYTPLTWALVYNLYVIADLAVLLVAGVFVLSTKNGKRLVLANT